MTVPDLAHERLRRSQDVAARNIASDLLDRDINRHTTPINGDNSHNINLSMERRGDE
jgi:hypothetical protein